MCSATKGYWALWAFGYSHHLGSRPRLGSNSHKQRVIPHMAINSILMFLFTTSVNNSSGSSSSMIAEIIIGSVIVTGFLTTSTINIMSRIIVIIVTAAFRSAPITNPNSCTFVRGSVKLGVVKRGVYRRAR